MVTGTVPLFDVSSRMRESSQAGMREAKGKARTHEMKCETLLSLLVWPKSLAGARDARIRV